VHRTTLVTAAVLSPALLSPISRAFAQQSDITISPFVSFLPTAGTSPLAGLALTLAGNGGFGLRASAHMALDNSNNAFANPGSIRPWGGDADAVLGLGSHGFSPFVFTGLGLTSADSLGYRTTHHNWSYGAGAALPLSNAIGLFGEMRWRMSRYVLPTANVAPSPTHEIRLGVSFKVGGSSSNNGGWSHGHRFDVGSQPSYATRAPRVAAVPTAPLGNMVVGTANEYVGVPYRRGGWSPKSGFDEAGFVKYVFDRHGVWLPSTAGEQLDYGEEIATSWRKALAGDVVFSQENDGVYHVAIYAGRNRIIQSSTAGGVRYEDLSSGAGKWFADNLVAVRRMP
jgi:hypothetical protein